MDFNTMEYNIYSLYTQSLKKHKIYLGIKVFLMNIYQEFQKKWVIASVDMAQLLIAFPYYVLMDLVA